MRWGLVSIAVVVACNKGVQVTTRDAAPVRPAADVAPQDPNRVDASSFISPIRVGLRWEHKDDDELTVVTLRMLLLDAEGRSRHLVLREDRGMPEGLDGVGVMGSVKPGAVGEALLSTLEQNYQQSYPVRFEYRVLRRGNALVVENRDVLDQGAGTGEPDDKPKLGPWQKVKEIALPATAEVKAAVLPKNLWPAPGIWGY